MVEIVLEEVVLGEVFEVGVLDEREVGGLQDPDIHGGRVGWGVVAAREGGCAGLVGEQVSVQKVCEVGRALLPTQPCLSPCLCCLLAVEGLCRAPPPNPNIHAGRYG